MEGQYCVLEHCTIYSIFCRPTCKTRQIQTKLSQINKGKSETDRQIYRHWQTSRRPGRHIIWTDKQKDSWMDRRAKSRLADNKWPADIWIEGCTVQYRMTVESTVMQTDRQAGEQTDKEIDGCTEGQLERQSNRFTDRRRRYRHRERWRDEQSASLIPFFMCTNSRKNSFL
jgi:hypothetical protein